MTYYLRDNSEGIRQKIESAGISVCVCASFKDACWLDYSTAVGNGVHGVGYYGGDTFTNSQQEALDMFLSEATDLVECKDVDDFIAKIKNS